MEAGVVEIKKLGRDYRFNVNESAGEFAFYSGGSFLFRDFQLSIAADTDSSENLLVMSFTVINFKEHSGGCNDRNLVY